ncbi:MULTISPECIES: STAS domain-containing protein [unclassified Streptomyces]|uniref:STAS domain-containing protein n=1 Tax=unclassified Streptomyces TaxID=2593676 RepID=UPI0029BFEDA1|nr:STAS domain-containing protein [Streptomyces sp. DK15]
MKDTPLRASLTEVEPGVLRVEVAGEADNDTCPVLRTALHDALEADPPPYRLEVDCAGLTFCSSACLNELLIIRLAARARGIAFTVTAASRPLRVLLTLTGTDTVFGTVPARHRHAPHPRSCAPSGG